MKIEQIHTGSALCNHPEYRIVLVNMEVVMWSAQKSLVFIEISETLDVFILRIKLLFSVIYIKIKGSYSIHEQVLYMDCAPGLLQFVLVLQKYVNV